MVFTPDVQGVVRGYSMAFGSHVLSSGTSATTNRQAKTTGDGEGIGNPTA